MLQPAVLSLKDLDPATQGFLANLFGKALAPNQKVMFYLIDMEPPHAAGKQQDAWARINKILSKASQGMNGTSEEEFDDALEEAMRHTRPRRHL